MAEKRTTSAAKDVELESYTPGPLDQKRDLSPDFRVPAVRDYYEPNYENDNEAGSAQGSQSVNDHAPGAERNMRPPDDLARPVDREAFEERQAALREAAEDAYFDQMLPEYEAELDTNQGPDRSRDNEQDYGM